MTYIGHKVMHATASSLALMSTVLGFDIVELWAQEDERPETLHCVYAHCEQSMKLSHPELVEGRVGYFPHHGKKHFRSPELCASVLACTDNNIWIIDRPPPLTTEMVYLLDTGHQKYHQTIFIVAFSQERITSSPAKLNFMAAVSHAIYVAAFEMDECATEIDGILDTHELDNRGLSFVPRSKSKSSLSIETNDVNSMAAVEVDETSGDYFSYPIGHLSVVTPTRNDLNLSEFSELKHLADGSNSNVYIGVLHSEKVVVKVIKENMAKNEKANQEFLVEYSLLSRLSHPNVIRIYGMGREPRMFIVLEYLQGGSLRTMLDKNVADSSVMNIFRKPNFTYPALLGRAKELAEAFRYIHEDVNEDAAIIHRDLKPDNVGFASDGTLKLYDFGLSACIKKHACSSDCYEMTGNTGSLRYMAPEVALDLPYNEKVDVYSYGILIWQMAKDRVPFKGLNREQFMKQVVGNHERPKLDNSLPAELRALLNSCWHSDHSQRPTFRTVCGTLDMIMRGMSPRPHATPPAAPQPRRWGNMSPRGVGVTPSPEPSFFTSK